MQENSYNCSAYGAGSYNSCAPGVPNTGAGEGFLSNLGPEAIGGLVGGGLLILISIVLLVKTLRRKKTVNIND